MGYRAAFRARFFSRCFLKVVRTARFQLPLARPALSIFRGMVFLPSEFTKKAEITILSARESTRPGLQCIMGREKSVYKGKCST